MKDGSGRNGARNEREGGVVTNQTALTVTAAAAAGTQNGGHQVTSTHSAKEEGKGSSIYLSLCNIPAPACVCVPRLKDHMFSRVSRHGRSDLLAGKRKEDEKRDLHRMLRRTEMDLI